MAEDRAKMLAAWSMLSSLWNVDDTLYNKAKRFPVRFASQFIASRVDSLCSLRAPTSRVLEVAASHGCFAEIIAEQFPRTPVLAATWLEESLDPLLAARERSSWNSVDIKYLEQLDPTSLASLPEPTAKAPWLTEQAFTHVFHNAALAVSPDTHGDLQQLFQCLQPGGILAISLEFMNSWMEAWVQAVRETIDPGYSPRDYLNQQVFDCTALKDMLESVGFVDTLAQTIVCPHASDISAAAIVEELAHSRQQEFQRLAPNVAEAEFKRAWPNLITNVGRKYTQNNRRPANIMVWAVGRRPPLDPPAIDDSVLVSVSAAPSATDLLAGDVVLGSVPASGDAALIPTLENLDGESSEEE